MQSGEQWAKEQFGKVQVGDKRDEVPSVRDQGIGSHSLFRCQIGKETFKPVSHLP